MSDAPPLRVVCLESRHEAEMARLLERHGCVAIRAPSLREIPLEDQHEAFELGAHLMAGECDVLVLLTGVGARLLVEALSTRWPREDVLAKLSRCKLVCRGPKPVAAIKPMGLRAAAVAPEPNTWQDVVAVMDRDVPVAGKRVFVQEYGKLSPALVAALESRGAEVRSISVYSWAMPEDVGPLQRAIEIMCADEADAIVFTSGQQIKHLNEAARMIGREDALHRALRERIVVASMGPMTSEALGESGVKVDLEPEHPKMGHIVTALEKHGARLRAEKTAR
jgi:uroporphyrinogen-III synthase